MKKYKKILNIVIFVVIFLIIPIFFLFSSKKIYMLDNSKKELQIFTIYHIETFEGGGKSRLSYLNEIARAFEKENKGILIMTKMISPDKLEKTLENEPADMISFGYGVGEIILPYLDPINSNYGVNDNFINSSTFNNKIYAIPYISSGYIIARKTNSNNLDYVYSSNTLTSCEPILKKLSITTLENTYTQYEAYKEFVNSTISSLIGTGRDLYRLKNLSTLGRLDTSFNYIDYYTDLIQYFGIIKTSEISLNFLEFLLDNENQMTLSEYSLFSTKPLTLYFSNEYKEMESAIKKCFVPNVFKKE